MVDVAAGPAERAEYLDAQWAADRPDVAHAIFWTSGLNAQLAARAHGVPTVQTFRSLAITENGHDMRGTALDARSKVERLLARQADWVVATCADELVDLMRLGRPRGKMSMVPCGVDIDAFSTEGSSPIATSAGASLPSERCCRTTDSVP